MCLCYEKLHNDDLCYVCLQYCKLYAKAEKALSNTFLQIARSLKAEKWNAEFSYQIYISKIPLPSHTIQEKQISIGLAKISKISASPC